MYTVCMAEGNIVLEQKILDSDSRTHMLAQPSNFEPTTYLLLKSRLFCEGDQKSQMNC